MLLRRSLLLTLALAACKGPPARTDDLPPPAQVLVPDLGSVAPEFGVAGAPVDADVVPELREARALCDALHALPARRSDACCNTGDASPQALVRADECAAALSSAAAGGGVIVQAEAVSACVAALELVHADCEWVGPNSPLPPPCREVVLGSLPAAARCRSSLECAPGLRCAGEPTVPGVCALPAVDGAPCDAAVDPLAGFLRDDKLAAHPGCSGRCVAQRCQPAATPGAACSSNDDCPASQHCDGKTCVAGASAAAGEACADRGCADDGVCLQQVCVARRAGGSACTSDDECRGACLKGADGVGRCGMKCP